MTPAIDITAEQRRTVLALLNRHLPDTTVWAYGSRVKWTSRPESDLDLVAFARPEQSAQVAELREAFEESDLPFRVDLLVWDEVPEGFRGRIKAECTELTSASAREWIAANRPHHDDNWTAFRLGDICKKIGSGMTPRGGSKVYLDTGSCALIRSQNVHNDGFRHGGLVFIDEKQATTLENVEVQPHDVLLNITGDSVARCCQVRREILPARVNQHVAIVRPDPEVLDPQFLRYALVESKMQERMLSWAGSGATRNALTKGMIELFEVLAPKKIQKQRAIAHILGTLDDKIELNRRMNETLEAMARALFKSWFVDFDPVRAKIEGRDTGLPQPIADLFPDRFADFELGYLPEGWGRRAVSHFATIKGGKQLSKDKFVEDGPVPVFGGAGVMGYTNSHNADGYVISVGRVGAYCGQFSAHRGRAWINNNASLIAQNGDVPGEWLFHALRNLDIDLIKKGAAQPFISNSDLAKMEIISPGDSIRDVFQHHLKPWKQYSEQTERETKILTALRDVLLPKLISGEIRIHDAARQVESVA